ncbi:peptidoglycan-binding LysM domain protein [Mycena alexandri]|uniref:Peptidoglycan-binding LysM domain protein n=1 Tax=Mycena alexandri TaxID=1745969 RepID=A0AAD6S2F9_9AGAR|nr:peptidoglycan-binding LysM domain protein [Mycena alexandri]
MSNTNGHKPMTPESVYFNPFAEDRQRTTAIDVPYLSQRPAVRRTGSGSSTATSSASSSSGLSVFTNTPRHMRIQTEGSTSVGHHPLRSADLSSGFRNGAGVTRPQLTRILNIPPLVDAPPVPGADMIVAEPAGDEKIVLVHEITSQDSLAGVSLKYGISMADLRRANHLWSSDPIHLRKVLYIPLDKTSRAKDLTPEPLLVSTEDMDQAAAASPTRPDNTAPMSTIRRIPASQLSFFPPHARSQEPDPPSPPAQAPARIKHPHSRHARYATTPSSTPGTASSPSLTSILTALPIQPSTRDTIIARLSYDSTGTTNSSFSDPDEGHELDDVRRGASLDSIFPSHEDATPKSRSRDPGAGPGSSATLTRAHARTASASSVYVNGAAQYRRAGPLRTVQLEPSPVMQLPFATLRRKGKTSEFNGDFDLLGLANGEGEGETVDDP